MTPFRPLIGLKELHVALERIVESFAGPSVHGILQARILDWVAIPFSRGLSQPRDETQVPRTAGRFFTVLIGDSVLFILSFCDFCLKKIDAFLDESGATQMLRQWRWGSRV